jgi:hypothetical protein
MPEIIEYPKCKPHRVRFVISGDALQESLGKITGKNRKVANLRESVGTTIPQSRAADTEINGRLRAIIDRAEQMVKQRSLPPCLDIAEILAPARARNSPPRAVCRR